MESENASPQRGSLDALKAERRAEHSRFAELRAARRAAYGLPPEASVDELMKAMEDAGVFEASQAEELARGDAEEAADAAGIAPPAPTGGRPPYAAAYYFTEKIDGVEITRVREVAVPGDATVECNGNTLVIRHEGVADTFRIGRVRPLEA